MKLHKDVQKAIDKFKMIEVMGDTKHETRLDSEPLSVELTGHEVDALFDILNCDDGLADFLKPQAF